ncbi:hypothetical protein FZC35_00810 [Candidatus Cytomitobacter indipagum]|uniref:Probable peptidoglycan glycosyltransferase FtsW n=1 Tax=Candidatus Cytomitobacter indipagum TaxID=2601575 RepID=A0A5C0UFV1_9PROT|nr:FtsW/RodA/SpoVE family cell cycle protein [Candidatus Cytomitobacter indipagum]QEK37924.1 hypothetical protein FZC35_00810 [Candidatus Cytomitobacter indipagum]
MILRSIVYLDRKILFCVASLCVISSFCMAAYGPASISRHILLWSLGASLSLYMHSKDSKLLIKISKILFIISIFLIIFAYFKSSAIKGSKRWISLFGISLQPSELLKSSCIIIASDYLFRKKHFKFFAIYCLGIALLIKQPDFGSILLLLSIMAIQLFISNIRIIHLFFFCFFSSIFASMAIARLPHVQARIFNFIYGKQSILEGGYQGFMSIQTIKSGGFFGLGIGKGIIKQYLPDAYSDFIFAVVGEELGVVGCVYLIYMFLLLGYSAFFNNRKLYRSVEYYINTSCISIFLIQAWINIASALWIIPTKGITLPFISHGGTSLLISFWTLSGILISSRKAKFSREIMPFDT